MANPILNEKAAAEAAKAGWGAPDPASRSTPIPGTPITDGPISPWSSGPRMTVKGTATAAGVLLVVLIAFATLGWSASNPAPTDGGRPGFPMLAIGGILLGFVCAVVVSFKPTLAKVLGPIYAVGMGFFLGVISHYYNDVYDGIVVQAVGATLGVFTVMLVLYKSRIIKVTDRFRRLVIMGTMGLMLFYLVAFVISLFGGSVPLINSASPMGILFSVLAAGLASMMLAVDFDLIERGAKEGWPKGMEWYGAFGLLTTLVWLYLEILRLLSKLRN